MVLVEKIMLGIVLAAVIAIIATLALV